MSAIKITHADIINHFADCTICTTPPKGKSDNYLQLFAMEAHFSR